MIIAEGFFFFSGYEQFIVPEYFEKKMFSFLIGIILKVWNI